MKKRRKVEAFYVEIFCWKCMGQPYRLDATNDGRLLCPDCNKRVYIKLVKRDSGAVKWNAII